MLSFNLVTSYVAWQVANIGDHERGIVIRTTGIRTAILLLHGSGTWQVDQ
jgi:hypothetical protein